MASTARVGSVATGLSVVAAAGVCDSSSFPSVFDNVVFQGLHQAEGVTSAGGCQQACCDEGATCAVWQWADQAPALPVGSCWIGGADLPSKPAPGWVSNATFPAPPAPPPAPPAEVPIPTAAMLRWMDDELGAIGHFNMGTYQACGIGVDLFEGNEHPVQGGLTVPPPETFAPTNVDVDSWMTALKSANIKHAVLVVSHGCGYNTFPTQTEIPDFGTYNYTIAQSPWKSGKGDIAAEFVAACRKNGIRPGFYYGAMNNAFLNVHTGKMRDGRACDSCPDITQDQYTEVLLGNLRQLWTDYGELAEVWFDGGTPPGAAEPLAALLAELQPNAVAFQGPGPNGIRWAGTENGHPAYPFWSTSDSSKDKGQGNADGAVFAPGEADTCFQTGAGNGPYGGCWFYNHGMVPKSLPELVSHYHDTAGRNAFSLLDWTPTQDGDMRADHLQRYEEYGDWLRGCYSVPVVSVGPVKAGQAASLSLPEGSQFDRLVIKEDLSKGELVRSYSVTLDGTEVATGTSVGHKRIVLLDATMSGQELSVSFSGVTDSATLAHVAAFNCSSTPEPTGCSFQQSFRYKIVDDITLSTIQKSSPQACCEACRSESECAVFVLDTEKTCTLLSANQGGDDEDGVLSGSPKGGLSSAAAAFV